MLKLLNNTQITFKDILNASSIDLILKQYNSTYAHGKDLIQTELTARFHLQPEQERKLLIKLSETLWNILLEQIKIKFNSRNILMDMIKM